MAPSLHVDNVCTAFFFVGSDVIKLRAFTPLQKVPGESPVDSKPRRGLHSASSAI